MNVFKNVLIVILSLTLVIFWLSPEDEEDDDSVTIEYSCSQLDDYESVPYEVREECAKRQKVKIKTVKET